MFSSGSYTSVKYTAFATLPAIYDSVDNPYSYFHILYQLLSPSLCLGMMEGIRLLHLMRITV